jgi:hypothetical protein
LHFGPNLRFDGIVTRHSFGFIFALVALNACRESGPESIGPPAALVAVAGDDQSALANTTVPAPIQIAVRDANGRGVPDQTVTFSIPSDGGGGFLEGTASATSDENGIVIAPTWRLGKRASPQKLRVTLNALTLDVDASVLTSYDIEVRFWGEQPMTDAQKALFTNAAQRIEGVIIGDVININALNSGVDLEQSCGVTGQPPLDEIIDDVIIYASIRAIDGPGQILAQAGYCLGRTVTGVGFMPGVGVMQFDSADIDRFASSLQQIITHEMLHVVGFGSIWDHDRTLIEGAGGPDPRYVGEQGRSACVGFGGTVSCLSDVPVENTGGAGTADGHWRESTFDTELMTGFIDSGNMPFSSMTIGSLADVGYTVNFADNDAFTMPTPPGALRTNALVSSVHLGWEKQLDLPVTVFEPDGRIRLVSRRK